ncbi:MAG: hydroxymethylbilane synthase [Chitinophagaceae bacterium]
MAKKLKIGTRESKLAIWQAEFIQNALLANGIESELVFIKTHGEMNVSTPLYEMGIQGIFTKTLDIALLNKEIDIAVHSLKDVPTQLAKGLVIAATPKRGNPYDVLVYKEALPQPFLPYLVATSSLRRSAQWLHRYPEHATTPLRGNINTRLTKMLENPTWDGAIFAAAGIERIQLDVPNEWLLNWMIPAPAQGALAVIARETDEYTKTICSQINDEATQIATAFERKFLRKLMGGCSMPIGGLAKIDNNTLYFKGCVLTTDGKQMSEVVINGSIDKFDELLDEAINTLFDNGGAAIIDSFKTKNA